MPTELKPAAAEQAQIPPAQAPDFKAFADDYLQKAFGKSVSWDAIDAEVAALPKDPTTGKATHNAEDVRKRVVDSYVNDVLPQHYPREALPQMQAKARAELDAKVTASALGSTTAQGAADPKTAGYDSLIKLEGNLKDPVKRAENTIALDKASRANGKKLISELGLSQIDAEARSTLIQEEIDKRKNLTKVIVDKFNAGEVPAEQAQADIDRIAREVTSLNGAMLDTKDASTWSTEAVWAAGGVGKALVSLPEFAGRVVNGTTNWLTDKPFAVGFADESGAVVGSMAQARQWITSTVEDWDVGDPSQVKLDAVMQAFDDNGFSGGLPVAANHPEVALRMLATSGVDSVAQFLTGGFAGAGTSAVVKGAMSGARSVAELNVLAQGAATARRVGGIGASTSYAALHSADDEKRYVTEALNGMGTDKFLSLEEVQKEKAVWGKLQGSALDTYIASKKQAIIDDAYTKVAGTTAALLAASGHIGSKYGVEAWLLGRRDALGAAAGASTGKRLAHGGLAGVVGGTHEGLEEVAETGTQHIFYVNALDGSLHDETPFSNFSGAFAQGFVVGGALDGFAGTRSAGKSPPPNAQPPNAPPPDDLQNHWTDDQLANPTIAARVDRAFAVFGGENSPYSAQGLKTTTVANVDGAETVAELELSEDMRARIARLSELAGDSSKPAVDVAQSRARHSLMLETARAKNILEARTRRNAYRTAMNAEREAKVDPNEWVRSGTDVQQRNQMTVAGIPEAAFQPVPVQGDELYTAPSVDPAQANLDFAPSGMNFDWLTHGANNPQSQATGTAADQIGLPLDAEFHGDDPLRPPVQRGLPFGAPYNQALTPKPYSGDELLQGEWQPQLDFSGVGTQHRIDAMISDIQQETQVPQQETQAQTEPRDLPPESNTALAMEAGIPVAEHHTSVANQLTNGVGVDVTVDAKGAFHVIVSSSIADYTRFAPISINNAVANAKTMLPTASPFDQANLAIKGVMSSVAMAGKVVKPAVVSAVRYAVLREVLSALPDNYVPHHPSGRRRSEKQMRKSATVWAGLHRTMVEERARIYDAPRSTTAYDYVVGNRTTLPPRLKPYRDELNDLRGKWFAQQNELEALGTDGIVDALVTAPEKTAKTEVNEVAQSNPVQAAVEKVAAVEVAQAVEDLGNGDLMPVEVATDVATTAIVQDQLQEQVQTDIATALDPANTIVEAYPTIQQVEELAEAQAETLGIALDTTAIDVAYEAIAEDTTPEVPPQQTTVAEAKPEVVSVAKPRKRRKAAFEPQVQEEAEYIAPPVESDQLADANYLNNDAALDAAIRVSDMKARKTKKIPLWQQDRDAQLAARAGTQPAPVDAATDQLVDVQPVPVDVLPDLVEQAIVQQAVVKTIRKGKRKVDVAARSNDVDSSGVAQNTDVDPQAKAAPTTTVAEEAAAELHAASTMQEMHTAVERTVDAAVALNAKKPKFQLVWMNALDAANAVVRKATSTKEAAAGLADALRKALQQTDAKTHRNESSLVDKLDSLSSTASNVATVGKPESFDDLIQKAYKARKFNGWSQKDEASHKKDAELKDKAISLWQSGAPLTEVMGALEANEHLVRLAKAIDTIHAKFPSIAPTRGVEAEGRGGYGQFMSSERKIVLYLKYALLDKPASKTAGTIIHEHLHGIAYAAKLIKAARDYAGAEDFAAWYQIDNASEFFASKPVVALLKFQQTLESAYGDLRTYAEKNTTGNMRKEVRGAIKGTHTSLYFLSNEHEMLAEMVMPEVAAVMNAAPSTTKGVTVLERVFKAFSELFSALLGGVKPNSVLANVSEALDTLYSNLWDTDPTQAYHTVPSDTQSNDTPFDGLDTAAVSSPITDTLDFSKGWLAAVVPHLTPAQQGLAKAADAVITQRDGDNNVYMSFDHTVKQHSGGFYVPAWDKAFLRYTNVRTAEDAAKTVLHEKLHQALRDVDALDVLRDHGVAGEAKSAVAKETAQVLDSMHVLLEHTRRAVADRVGKDAAHNGVLYGLTSASAFRAELANPAFGRVLAAIDAPHSGSVLGAMLRAVRKLFGLHVPSVRDVALNDLHRLLQITAGKDYSAASRILNRAHAARSANMLSGIENSGYARLTPNNPAALYAAAQRDGFGSPAMQAYARRQVVDVPLDASTLNAQFDKMEGC
ncbi:MAG: hypothetical protein ACKO0Z_27120 [Betaproteobacteria bacterium]